MHAGLNRRELLKTVTFAFTKLALPGAEPNAPLFFSNNEFALLEALTELIIPTDDHSPGARSAGVARYIDRAVAESFLPEEKSSWTKGLALVNRLSQDTYGIPFLNATRVQQQSLLQLMAENEFHAAIDAERFFGQLKETTAFAYYSSSVGIHEDIEYKGNTILEQFQGYDAT